jgi:uncharacterized membrane protein YphA (DoxX/SURF4 family)
MWFTLRIAIGGIFVFSALGKLLEPYQNFLYVIQAYQILPSWAEILAAQIFPWLEMIVGIFVLLGLWLPWSLRAALIFFSVFVVIVGQALLRGLPLENCGCFGEFIHLKPQTVLIMDSFSVLLTFVMLCNLSHTKKFSLDSYFDRV